ncbi:MAG: site-specific integrase [Acidobacteria bacterium]|nr:site-specific integrase [Acidobacteriota bacterium]
MAVYRRNNRWWFRLQIRGLRYARAVPEATAKKQAQAAETRFKNELLQGKYDLVDEARLDTTFGQYSKQYLRWSKENKKSWASDVSRMTALVNHFGGTRMCDISPIDIERFKIERRKSITRTGRLRTQSSVNRELQLLRHVFSMALRDGVIRAHPLKGKVKLYRENNKVERYLTEQEERRLLAACVGRYEHLHPIIVCALYTGMRRGEIFNLRWADVDLKASLIQVRESKSGRPRTIHLAPKVSIEVQALLPLAAETEFVFGNPNTGEARTDLKRGFASVCRAAGIHGLRFHDLRHTFATRLAAESGNIVDVAHVLGHSQISTTMRYAHALPNRVAEAIDRMATDAAEVIDISSKERLSDGDENQFQSVG